MFQGTIRTEINVAVPMRDGTELRADVYLPDDGGPFPTVVIRTPYDKWRAMGYYFHDPIRLARNGYAMVMQDCRGCSASGGDFYPWRSEAQDGYDTIEWVARQSWSNGRVGMHGFSYLGSVQWMAAAEAPPHLTAIAPGMSLTTLRNLVFRGGVFQLQVAQTFALTQAAKLLQRRPPGPELVKHLQALLAALDSLDRQADSVPMTAWPVAKNIEELGFYFDWLAHPSDDDYWREFKLASFEKTKVPAFVVGGWHDACSAAGAISAFASMNSDVKEVSRLVVGPWGHEMLLLQRLGELDFGMRASGDGLDLMGLHLRWFDYWLKGIDNGIINEPPVRIFVMGDNVWRTENEWPLARTRYTPYYLRRLGNEGYLSPEPPTKENPDIFEYDPRHPVPTHGGSVLHLTRGFGPLDQREIERRSDVLVYSTPVLEADLEVTGPVTMKLFARSSVPDTDFTAKLVDVWPDGNAYILLDGIVRARYRDSEETPSFIEPDQVYEYTIDLVATSNVFKAGHRIRLEVSSSNFPKYDRNPNTGHEIGVDAETQVATQRIFHDSQRPSHLILPVIPR